jgi:hypothetical protein
LPLGKETTLKVLKLFLTFTFVILFPATVAFAGNTSMSVYLTAWENSSINYTTPDGYVISSIDFASYGTPKTEFAIGECNSKSSMEKVLAAVTNTTLQIDASNSVFGDPCGGTYKWLEVLLIIDIDPEYVVPTPTEPSPRPTEIIIPIPTVLPTLEPSPSDTPTPEPTPEPSDTFSPTPTPEPTPTDTMTPLPEPTPKETLTPSPEPTPEIVVPTPVETQTPEPDPTASTVPTLEPEPTPVLEPTQNVTPEPPTTVTELLSQYTPDEAIPFDVLMASGIDYSELPPDQPVTLKNGVVLTAAVADALQLFENPSELLSEVFTNPGKALKAISNVGADLPKEVRKKAQQGTVAVVLVGQVIIGGVTASLIRR